MHSRCQAPSFDELPNSTINEPLDWDLVANFRKNPTQTDASYKEKFAIKVCDESINSYSDLMNNDFVKNIIIAGFTGGEKTFVMIYILIYARSKGLTVITVDIMCDLTIQLCW